MSSIHELLKQVYPLNLRMELFNAIWTGWRADIKEKDQRIAELEKQLKNAIVPKFKIGQECWGIVPKTFWNKESYTIHFKVKAYIPDNNGIVVMLEDSITNLHYSYECQLFVTQEEAKQKLTEISRGKND